MSRPALALAEEECREAVCRCVDRGWTKFDGETWHVESVLGELDRLRSGLAALAAELRHLSVTRDDSDEGQGAAMAFRIAAAKADAVREP